MDNLIIAWVSIFFSGYIFFDAMAVLARASASSASLNAFGAAIEKIMNALKRLSIFTFPPALGYFVYTQNESALFLTIFIAYGFAGMIILGVLIFRNLFLSYFNAVALAFGAGHGIFYAFISKSARKKFAHAQVKEGISGFQLFDLLRDNLGLFLLASWVYFVFGASIFLINLIAMRFIDLAPIVLQALGFLNGLGTLVLAFFVDPKISRFLDKKYMLNEMVLIILLAQLTGVWIYSYIFFSVIFYLL